MQLAHNFLPPSAKHYLGVILGFVWQISWLDQYLTPGKSAACQSLTQRRMCLVETFQMTLLPSIRLDRLSFAIIQEEDLIHACLIHLFPEHPVDNLIIDILMRVDGNEHLLVLKHNIDPVILTGRLQIQFIHSLQIKLQLDALLSIVFWCLNHKLPHRDLLLVGLRFVLLAHALDVEQSLLS